MIGVKDYENINGFGMSTYEQIAELNKALSAGYDVPAATGGVSGSGLRVESLEASLKIVTYLMQHIKFWQKIPKLPAFSTVEEYNRLVSYGSEGGAFAPEGELNTYDDTTYTRQVSLVKYLQTVRKVTHPMTLVRTAHGDVIGNEIKNGIMWLLGKVEHYLYNGDNRLRLGFAAYASGSPTAEGYEFPGLKIQIDSGNIIDALGDPLSEDILETGANVVIENYGFPTDILIGTRPLADLAKVMFPKERIIVPFKEGQVGVPLNTFASQAGTLAFNPDIFLRKKFVLSTTGVQGPTGYTPTAPQSVAITVTGSTGAFNKTGNGLGNYYYAVTYGNRYGESAPTVSDVAAVTAATDTVTLTIRNAGSVVVAPDFINIYRTVAGGVNTGPFYLIARAAALQDGNNEYQRASDASNPGVFPSTGEWGGADTNSICANCHDVYMGEMTPQVLMFKQLAPLMKMDLAIIEPAIRWVQLLYGVPQLYAPRKWVRIKNVGEATV